MTAETSKKVRLVTELNDWADKYQGIRFSRENSVLEMTLRTRGGSPNRVVILTGTCDSFLASMDPAFQFPEPTIGEMLPCIILLDEFDRGDTDRLMDHAFRAAQLAEQREHEHRTVAAARQARGSARRCRGWSGSRDSARRT
jgi:hypothetical protein